jgi:hypothetical protein
VLCDKAAHRWENAPPSPALLYPPLPAVNPALKGAGLKAELDGLAKQTFHTHIANPCPENT